MRTDIHFINKGDHTEAVGKREHLANMIALLGMLVWPNFLNEELGRKTYLGYIDGMKILDPSTELCEMFLANTNFYEPHRNQLESALLALGISSSYTNAAG